MEKRKNVMKDWKHDLFLWIIKVLNVVLLVIPFAICWYRYYAFKIVSPFYNRGNWIIILLFLILYVLFVKIYDGFLVSLNRISELIYSQVLAVIFTNFILYFVICLLMKGLPNLLLLLLVICCQIVMSTIWSIFAHRWYFAYFPARESVVIYDIRQGIEGLICEYGLEKKFHIRIVVDVKKYLQNMQMIDEMDTVFLSGVHSHDRNIILKYCVQRGIAVYVIPCVGDVLMSGAKRMHMLHLPMLQVRRCQPSSLYILIKRVLDIIVSSIAIILLSPILVITAIAIKVVDGGPVLYKQKRLTKDGREFNVLKFRSMFVNAEIDGVARLSTGENDDRITPVGRIIRRVRIDELPQLFCIIKGEMSLVGPRPERPEISRIYEKELPEFRLRLQVKAGLTGYAQVYGKYNTTPYDKLQMDLMYISNPSIVEDLKIMFATIKIFFMPESTEGIREGKITALIEATEEAATFVGNSKQK